MSAQALRDQAQRFYRQHLVGDQTARRYLSQRGVPAELARRLQLGSAPGTWTTVGDLLRGRGYTDGELLAAGVGCPHQQGPDRRRLPRPGAVPAQDEVGSLGRSGYP